MAPTLKLQYFDFDFWRAEGCRLTMHVGGLVRLQLEPAHRSVHGSAPAAGECTPLSMPELTAPRPALPGV